MRVSNRPSRRRLAIRRSDTPPLSNRLPEAAGTGHAQGFVLP